MDTILIEDQALHVVLGRVEEDFGVGGDTTTDGDSNGIDNDGLDFSQLEEYINQVDDQEHRQHNEANLYYHDQQQNQHVLITSSSITSSTSSSSSECTSPSPKNTANIQNYHIIQASYSNNNCNNNTNTNSILNLPDSPPDSGSEPPFSPKSNVDHHQQQNKQILTTEIATDNSQQQKSDMENSMKHFVNDYSHHNNNNNNFNNHNINNHHHHHTLSTTNNPNHIKLETTSLNHIPQSHHHHHDYQQLQQQQHHHQQSLQNSHSHHHIQPQSLPPSTIPPPVQHEHQQQQQIVPVENHPHHHHHSIQHHHHHHHHQSSQPSISTSSTTTNTQLSILESHQMVTLGVATGTVVPALTGPLTVNSVSMIHNLSSVTTASTGQASSLIQTNHSHHQNNTNIYGHQTSPIIDSNNSYLSRIAITPPDCHHYTTLQTPQQQQQQPQSNLTPVAISISNNTSNASNNSVGGKKRKMSEAKNTSGTTSTTTTANIYIKQEPNSNSLSPDSGLHTSDNINGTSAANNNVHSTQCEDDFYGDYGPKSQTYADSFYQCIRFTPFNTNLSCPLYDVNFKEIPTISYRVDADKGFNFSNADDAFVCQKKNHFQVTVHIQIAADPFYAKTSSNEMFHKIDNFYLHFYGVKVESPTQTVKVEQSQSDRSKKAFHPVRIELSSEQVTKMTVGRLHFSETTMNNMRKKSKPNPDQRYFYLVVSLCAHVGDQIYQIAAQASERIIVRASNPGQFENDVELVWQKGVIPETIFHTGRVGINTDRPDESLVVFGNAKVTGNIMQPSDERAKTNIEEVDTREQLKNVSNMRIVRYQFKPSFAKEVGINNDELNGTGVLAQEVQKILPEAVKETGDIVLSNGETIENFLIVNKDRIFMENLGAVKELCKVTDNLETRIDELERMNTKLNKFNRIDSIKSNTSSSTITCISNHFRNYNNNNNNKNTIRSCHKRSSNHHHHHHHKSCSTQSIPINNGCNNKFFQTLIMILIFIMAFCLASIATLYILEYHRRHHSTTITTAMHQSSIPISSSSSFGLEHSSFLNVNNHQHNNNLTNKQYYLNKDRNTNINNPRPTAIPVLKPQVIGSPNGCYDYSSTLCPIYCCTDENYNVYHLNSNIETTNNDPNKSNFVVDHKLVKNNNPTEELNDTISISINNSTNNNNNNSSKILITNDSLSSLNTNQSIKFNSSNNNNKKKRTDKGMSFNDENKFNNKFLQTSSIQDIHNLNDFNDNGNEKFHRKKRETSKTSSLSNQNNMYNVYPKKDLSRTVEMIKLIELNTTIDYSYCTKLQCTQGIGNKFHYIIPISKYMELEYVTLQFGLNEEMKVDHCEMKEKPLSCSSGYYGVENVPQSYKKSDDHILLPESNPHWRLPIGIYQRSSYIFRLLARDIIIDTPCKLPESQAGSSFVEYKFEFIRKCDK